MNNGSDTTYIYKPETPFASVFTTFLIFVVPAASSRCGDSVTAAATVMGSGAVVVVVVVVVIMIVIIACL